jgi:hypothetical protein
MRCFATARSTEDTRSPGERDRRQHRAAPDAYSRRDPSGGGLLHVIHSRKVRQAAPFRHRRNWRVLDLQEAWQSTRSSDWSGRPCAYRSSSTQPESRAAVARTGDHAWRRWGGIRWRRSCRLAGARPRLDKPTTAPADGAHFQKAPHRESLICQETPDTT